MTTERRGAAGPTGEHRMLEPPSGTQRLDVRRLPVNPATGEPILPRAQPGYYPGYSTLRQQAFWDQATRDVVLDRVRNVPPIRFFAPEEARLMQAVCDRVLPQDDRDEAHKIPILPAIDRRLHENQIGGYQFEDMPPDREAYRLGLRAIEAIAQHLYMRSFVELDPGQQDRVLVSIHDGSPPAAEDIWRRMSVKHFWSLLVRDCVGAYYAHPYAWDEIGFGGPAYPRGYMRLQGGKPEPWEVPEQRYEWEPPPHALSGRYSPPDDVVHERQQQAPGQGGTHEAHEAHEAGEHHEGTTVRDD